MYYRLARSAITVLILSLAVAFLSYVLNYGILSHDAEYSAYTELKANHLIGEWVSRLSAPDQKPVIFADFLTKDNDRIQEFAAWAGLTDQDIFKTESAATQLNRFYEWFKNIPLSSRAILIADKDPAAVAEELTIPEKMNAFIAGITSLKLKPPLDAIDAMKKVIDADLPYLLTVSERIQSGQNQAIRKVREGLDTVPLVSYFIAQSEDFRAQVESAGYRLSREDFKTMGDLAITEADAQKFSSLIAIPEVQAPIARHLGIQTISEATAPRVIGWCTNRGRALWLADLVNKNAPGSGLTAAKLENIGKVAGRNALLEKIVPSEIPQKRTSLLSLPEKARWLVLLSFIVCIVGITNTMLMSVTDRFSEIATMKCIGAMDGFIMLLFVFEAFLQAIIGSVLGVTLGFALSFIRGLFSYNILAIESLRVLETIGASALSFITGIAIAAVAATWPSWAAARLAPMEAMRVE
jgi:putative ABC transport system permease protein